jgi:hypothetical protein
VEEANLSARIRSNFAKLYHQGLDAGGDDATRAAALKTAKDALVVLGQGDKISDKSTPAEIFKLLQARIADALNHPEDIPKIDKALTTATKEQ